MNFEDGKFNNLIKTDPARQKEIARAGGIASGKARQTKKAKHAYYKALLDASMECDFITPEEIKEFRKWQRDKEQIKAFKNWKRRKRRSAKHKA